MFPIVSTLQNFGSNITTYAIETHIKSILVRFLDSTHRKRRIFSKNKFTLSHVRLIEHKIKILLGDYISKHFFWFGFLVY